MTILLINISLLLFLSQFLFRYYDLPFSLPFCLFLSFSLRQSLFIIKLRVCVWKQITCNFNDANIDINLLIFFDISAVNLLSTRLIAITNYLHLFCSFSVANYCFFFMHFFIFRVTCAFCDWSDSSVWNIVFLNNLSCALHAPI